MDAPAWFATLSNDDTFGFIRCRNANCLRGPEIVVPNPPAPTPCTMKYINLGASGLRISPIGVGCLSFGNPDGRDPFSISEEESLPVLEHCYSSGLNFYDTANVYSNGRSEEILGKAIKKFGWKRESIVIATKVFEAVGDPEGAENTLAYDRDQKDDHGYVNQYGLSRKHIFEAVDASLRRLGTNYIDILQIHRFDPDTPPRETMEALHDVVKSGKARYIGASSMRTHQLLELQYTARMNGWTEFVSMQNLYNPTYREEEAEMFPACAKFGMGGIPWSPVAMGFLVRPWRDFNDTKRGKTQPSGFMDLGMTDADKRINEEIEKIANDRHTSMAIVSLAWCLSKPFIHSPIVGMSNKARVDEAIQAIDLKLTIDEIKSIDDLYQPKRVVGHK